MSYCALLLAAIKGIDWVDKLYPELKAWEGIKTVEYFHRALFRDVHALYSRALNRRDFIFDAGNIIDKQLTEAWMTGADEMMVLPEDMTDDDRSYLKDLIDNEKDFLDGLADDVEQARSDKTGWEQFSDRLDIWANRYNDVINQARLYFGGKEKLVWHFGDTDHCDVCAALDGIVAYATEWEQSGFHPQRPPNPLLTCEGWHCACTLTPTNERHTTNALDKLMDLASGHFL